MSLGGDLAMERYKRIRMVVFTPEYLIAHVAWTEDDFTALIDTIVALQEKVDLAGLRREI